MTNREKILHDCDEAADALIAKEAMAKFRMHERINREERNVMTLAFAASILMVVAMLAVVWIISGGGK
mgnify:CR=1 FL=1